MKDEYVLLLDVGGTFTKIAVAKNKKIVSAKIMETKELHVDDVKRLAEDYKKLKEEFSKVIIACAGPVKDGKCQLANANLSFDEKLLSAVIGAPVKLINDLEAVAYVLALKNKSSLLIGLGTGLGISLIDEKGKIIASEEGHLLIERDLFFSVPELRSTIIPQYEYILGAKKNTLMKLLKKEEKEIVLVDDRFTEIYLQVLDAFIKKMITSHSAVKLKKIIFIGGIALGNKRFLEKYFSQIKKKFKVEVEITDDKFIGVKGALTFCYQKQKSL